MSSHATDLVSMRNLLLVVLLSAGIPLDLYILAGVPQHLFLIPYGTRHLGSHFHRDSRYSRRPAAVLYEANTRYS